MQVRLQGIGWWNASAVKNLAVGDVILWNFGYTSEVLNMLPTKTGKQITVTLRSCETGAINDRRMGADRLVAIYRRNNNAGDNRNP